MSAQVKARPLVVLSAVTSISILAATEENSGTPELGGIKRRTMAETLMVRPYGVASSSHGASRLFLRRAQPPKSFVSTVLLNRSMHAGCSKLHAPRDCIREGYAHGRSSGFRFVPVDGRRFSTRATHVNDDGSIDSALRQSMEKKVRNISTVFLFIFFLKILLL